MRQLFISYARENKPDVEALIRDLDALGYQAWVDSHLRGGQTWWGEILQRIAHSDVFVAVVSEETLSSLACERELEWALALNKPVLPLSVGRLPDALPRALAMWQIIDYSTSAREAAFALAGALGNLPAAPPLPEPLPEPPPAPLSYLSELVEKVAQAEELSHEQQHQVLIQLEPALRAADAEERRGGRYVLDMFRKRKDLYVDVDHRLANLLASADSQSPTAGSGTVVGRLHTEDSTSLETEPPSNRGETDRKPTQPGDAPPPGWYPDPSGRHEWRWFERDWSDHVADGGVESVDP